MYIDLINQWAIQFLNKCIELKIIWLTHKPLICSWITLYLLNELVEWRIKMILSSKTVSCCHLLAYTEIAAATISK